MFLLKKKWNEWGRSYQQQRLKKPNCRWDKRQHKKKIITLHLRPLLLGMTNDHCSFCDLMPVVPYTIEHFRPRSKYPKLTYQWRNLFICCGFCQQANTKNFKKEILKPDKVDYEYERYFFYNPVTGKLEPNPKACLQDQNKALITIAYYKLNEFGRPEHRKREIKKFTLENDLTIDDFSFRYLFL